MSHCKLCNNCVSGFDHHCNVLGNCVGIRNWKNFVLTIFVMTMLNIYQACFSAYLFIELWNKNVESIKDEELKAYYGS